MTQQDDILNKVEALLASKLRDDRPGDWDAYLEGLGVRRVSKIVGLVVDPKEGHVRISDPMGSGGNFGFVEMPMATALKVASIGLP